MAPSRMLAAPARLQAVTPLNIDETGSSVGAHGARCAPFGGTCDPQSAAGIFYSLTES